MAHLSSTQCWILVHYQINNIIIIKLFDDCYFNPFREVNSVIVSVV